MNNVWILRAEFGTYTEHFLKGGYGGIAWFPDTDLSLVKDQSELYPIYKKEYPKDTSNVVIGQQVGQVARFLFSAKAGDYFVTPAADTERLHFGVIGSDPSYYYASDEDGCPYRHRRRVTWDKRVLKRSTLSVPFQNTIRASLTIFSIQHRDEFFEAIERPDLVVEKRVPNLDPTQVVIEQLMQLDPKEFEILVGHLLTALGFDGSEVVGKSGDGGVDATGELNASNLAKVKIFVQAKRYKPGTRISAGTVRELRQAIPFGGQGAFITTADYQVKAMDVAVEPGFPRIGLINGRQLVDLLVEHWNDIPADFQELLGLKPGLVRL